MQTLYHEAEKELVLILNLPLMSKTFFLLSFHPSEQ